MGALVPQGNRGRPTVPYTEAPSPSQRLKELRAKIALQRKQIADLRRNALELMNELEELHEEARRYGEAWTLSLEAS
jgi:hypothetical protein